MITNQDEVRRFREKAFKKHGCDGWWREEYATMTLKVLCQELQVKSETWKAKELSKVIRDLQKNGF